VRDATQADSYVYDAFGTVITNTGTTANYYRYSGEQYDPNLGFYYLRDRYMNPNSGRFLSRDSFAGKSFDPVTLHRYTYCGNDPINHLDPSGKDFGIIEIAVVAVVALVILGGIYAYLHIVRPANQELNAKDMNDNVLKKAEDQLHKYSSVDKKIDLLLSVLDYQNDGANASLYVKVFDGPGAGQHFEPNQSALFVANSTLTQGSLATALVMFAEFQHDIQSGEIQNEVDAQTEFSGIRESIRQIDPSAITPYIDGLKHGAGGF